MCKALCTFFWEHWTGLSGTVHRCLRRFAANHRRIDQRWMSSSRKKEALQRRRATSVAGAEAAATETSLPAGITPEMIAMAMGLQAAGIGRTVAASELLLPEPHAL